ncbi:MAG: PilT protein domain protein [Chlamydiia bacterium]|nr:PilT protein domain protein [Chlamydiia bacterium]
MFVLDCSVTMAWLFEDERTEFSERVLDKLQKEKAIVPSLWLLEVMNVLLVAEKRKQCTVAQSIRFLETLKSLPIEIDEGIETSQCESLLLIGRAYDLSSYDTVYLDLALRLGHPLATLDAHLRKASKSAGITVLN